MLEVLDIVLVNFVTFREKLYHLRSNRSGLTQGRLLVMTDEYTNP